MLEREPYAAVWRELANEKAMVLLAGPRQCGKTTLAHMVSTDYSNTLYFNWDVATDKRRLIEDPYFFQGMIRKDESKPLIIFDEIHKYKDWKNYLKGVYDRFSADYQFLVSGSGRLDLYQRGGDSLAGRYYAFRLWPLTLGEIAHQGNTIDRFTADPTAPSVERVDEAQSVWERLTVRTGFPEPYLAKKQTTYRRWSTSYRRQLIREDIRDLTGVKYADDMEILFALLPSRVGSPLSIANLAGDLKVAYNTIKSWLTIFQRFYLTLELSPWTGQIARAIHKARKAYLFDYGGIDDAGAKFENMVALELHRAVCNWNDMGWGEFGLHYIRTKEGREVDFIITQDRRPLLLVEAKLGRQTPSANLLRFQKALGIPAVQLLSSGAGYAVQRHAGLPLLTAPVAYWVPNLP